MDSVALWAAIAAVGAIGIVVTSILSGSSAAVSRGRQEREGDSSPAGPEPGARPANEAPGGMRMAQLASSVVLVVAVVVLLFILIF